MQDHELMKSFSRSTYKDWTSKLVKAAHDKCTEEVQDNTECIRNPSEVSITMDVSKKPNITPILDVDGNIKSYVPLDPLKEKVRDWEMKSHYQRTKAYTSNNLIVCSIIKASIKPYYI